MLRPAHLQTLHLLLHRLQGPVEDAQPADGVPSLHQVAVDLFRGSAVQCPLLQHRPQAPLHLADLLREEWPRRAGVKSKRTELWQDTSIKKKKKKKANHVVQMSPGLVQSFQSLLDDGESGRLFVPDESVPSFLSLL